VGIFLGGAIFVAGALSFTVKMGTAHPGAAAGVTQFLGLAKAFRALVDLIEILANIAGIVRKRHGHDKVVLI
jgi:hypothetical protein